MLAVFLALTIAQAAASLAPLPGWNAAPLQASEYARYIRPEPDGTQSTLVANTQVCDCQPAKLVSMLQTALSVLPSAVFQIRAPETVCGQPANRIVVTGLAGTSPGAQNFEMIAFRNGSTLYTLEYSFMQAAPKPDAENALASLCPTSTPAPQAAPV